MDIEYTTIVSSYTMTDAELEEILTKLANEFPDKVIMRMRTPVVIYGKDEYVSVSRMIATPGFLSGNPEDVSLDEIHIEELRCVIRKSDVFMLHSIMGTPSPFIDPYTFKRKISWKVKYAAKTKEV